MGPPTSLSSSSYPGKRVVGERYLVGDELGRGAYSRVYKGIELHGKGSFVALKEFPRTHLGSDNVEAVQVEVTLLKKLNHSTIVKYLDSVATAEHLYIVLEFVENGSIADLVRPGNFGTFPEGLAALYVRQVLEGLAYLHGQGVLHRDIKGANLLVTKEGRVKLADFGVALNVRGPHGGAGGELDSENVAGTPYWMAPEVIEMSGVSAASDIWSLGCTVVELVTGRPPLFDLGPIPAVYRIVQENPFPLPDGISASLEDFLKSCFKRNPQDRGTAASLLEHPWVVQAAAQSRGEGNGVSPTGVMGASSMQADDRASQLWGNNKHGPTEVHGRVNGQGDVALAAIASTSAPAPAPPERLPGASPDLTAEVVRLLNMFQPNKREGVILSACQRLLDLFQVSPESKGLFAAGEGVIPLMDVLQDDSHPAVRNAVLRVVNEVMDGSDPRVQEALCNAGIIPVVLRAATPEPAREIPKSTMLEAARFIRHICFGSAMCCRMFVGCLGFPVLVSFLDVHEFGGQAATSALDCVERIFQLAEGDAPARNGYCRLFVRAGAVPRLIKMYKDLFANKSGRVNFDDLLRVSALIALFSEADTLVQCALAACPDFSQLLLRFQAAPAKVRENISKTIENLSANPRTHEWLQGAGVLRHLATAVSDLWDDTPDLPALRDPVNLRSLMALYNLCRLSKVRQEAAASLGIVPVLKSVALAGLSLPSRAKHAPGYGSATSGMRRSGASLLGMPGADEVQGINCAVLVLCDLASSSRRVRSELWRNDVLSLYVDLVCMGNDQSMPQSSAPSTPRRRSGHSRGPSGSHLDAKDSWASVAASWPLSALDSVYAWLLAETTAVERGLQACRAPQKLHHFFAGGSPGSPQFQQVLSRFNLTATRSVVLSVALVREGVVQSVLDLVDRSADAVTNLALLRFLATLYYAYPSPKELVLKYGLQPKLRQMLAHEGTPGGGGSVLAAELARRLLQAMEFLQTA